MVFESQERWLWWPIGSTKGVGSVRREPLNGDSQGLEEASDTFL